MHWNSPRDRSGFSRALACMGTTRPERPLRRMFWRQIFSAPSDHSPSTTRARGTWDARHTGHAGGFRCTRRPRGPRCTRSAGHAGSASTKPGDFGKFRPALGANGKVERAFGAAFLASVSHGYCRWSETHEILLTWQMSLSNLYDCAYNRLQRIRVIPFRITFKIVIFNLLFYFINNISF